MAEYEIKRLRKEVKTLRCAHLGAKATRHAVHAADDGGLGVQGAEATAGAGTQAGGRAGFASPRTGGSGGGGTAAGLPRALGVARGTRSAGCVL